MFTNLLRWLPALGMAAGLCPVLVAMAQPANDNCATVQAAAANIPGAGGVIPGTTVGASSDGMCSCDDLLGGNLDVFYKFIPSVSGTWQFSLCTGPTFDSVMSLHSGCPANAINEIICNDDGCGGIGVPSVFTASLTAGTAYLVRVGMWDSLANIGNGFTLTVANLATSGACCSAITGVCTTSTTGVSGCAGGTTFQGLGTVCTPNPCPAPPPPANDECIGAIAITLGAVANGTTVFATASGTLTTTGTGSCTQATFAIGTHKDLWYRFVAPATTNYVLDTCGSTMPDTIISIHSGCPADQANILDCNDDSTGPAGNTACTFNGLNSRIQSVALTAGQTYYIGVAGYNGASGAFNLLVNFVDAALVGSCCVTTTCTLSDTANCAGTFTAGGTCTPNPCAPAGVCCRGSTCTTTITSAAACTASLIGGQAAGASFPSAASCNVAIVSNAPCCYADYNKVGGITVGDIFNFLTDWFSGSPYARTGSTGAPGPLAVQNIFDFLTNWFAGGC